MKKPLIPFFLSLYIIPCLIIPCLTLPSSAFSANNFISVSNCDGDLLASEAVYDENVASLKVITSSAKASEVRLTRDLDKLSARVENGAATFSNVPLGAWRACSEGKINSVVFGEAYGSSLFQAASAAIGGGAALGGLIVAFDESSAEGSSESSTIGSPSVSEASSSQTTGLETSASKPPQQFGSRPFAAEEDCLNDDDAPELSISPSS